MSLMINNMIIDKFPILFLINMADLNPHILKSWGKFFQFRFQCLTMSTLCYKKSTQSAEKRTNQIESLFVRVYSKLLSVRSVMPSRLKAEAKRNANKNIFRLMCFYNNFTHHYVSCSYIQKCIS